MICDFVSEPPGDLYRQVLEFCAKHCDQAALVIRAVDWLEPEAIAMSTAEIATIAFIERDSGDNAGAVVRVVNNLVAVGFWIEHNGDLDIAMGDEAADLLAGAAQDVDERLSTYANSRAFNDANVATVGRRIACRHGPERHPDRSSGSLPC